MKVYLLDLKKTKILFKRKKTAKKKEKILRCNPPHIAFFIFPKAYGINTAQPHSPFIYSVSFWKKFAAT